MKVEYKEKWKGLREWEVVVSMKERKTKKRENEKYYLYQGLKLFTLGYKNWVRLSEF